MSTQLDQAFFSYVSGKLNGSTIEEICAYYVQNLVFHNADYLKYLQATYNLPNDILKLHNKIVKLANK